MIEKIKNIQLLSLIEDEILNTLINKNQIKLNHYNKGIIVYEQKEKCSGMDFVLTGNFIAYSLAPNGSETVVFEFEKGDIIGANLLFSEKNRYPLNIYSTSESTSLYISKSAILQLLKDYNFTLHFIKSISQNSVGMNHKIAMYTNKTLRENLVDYLLSLSRSQNSKEITLPISKKQLADYFGVQRPSLFRELKKMKDEGLLEVNNRNIRLNF